MAQMLIVEDQPTDIRIAADVAQALGIDVEARTSASAAKLYLESAIEGKQVFPDIVLLDLDLGYESGHEILRFWHGNSKLTGIRMVVWTVMGEAQQALCRLFNVTAVVPKWEGADALKRMLKSLVPRRPGNASQSPPSNSFLA
ncbi:MAG TPA: response regulator [Terriglobales bacterium]|nr:response regulator [Terriglobales bacterium]